MGKIFHGNKKCKIFRGNKKIKKAYLGGNKIYSSGNIVTYIINGTTQYKEEVDEGEDVLHPKTFIPTVNGATFVGWVDSSGQTNVLTEMIMGDEPITLYGVFKYNDIVLLHTEFGSGNSSSYVAGPYNIDPNKYTFWLYTANYGAWERSGAYSEGWVGHPRYSESKDEWDGNNGAVKYIGSYANEKVHGYKVYFCPDEAKNITPRPNTYITWEGSNRSYSSAKLVAVGKTISA